MTGRSRSSEAAGIIPARAGFTLAVGQDPLRRRDHPRSRGVYGRRCVRRSRGRGSSPLARGLHQRLGDLGGELRIIPARAGFTRAIPTQTGRPPDHPRSRGVYGCEGDAYGRHAGSSPLARGLLTPPVGGLRFTGIIPARAGFTRRAGLPRRASEDHPRSRGVYVTGDWNNSMNTGSSPLARGLPAASAAVNGSARIIPARAGFTHQPKETP